MKILSYDLLFTGMVRRMESSSLSVILVRSGTKTRSGGHLKVRSVPLHSWSHSQKPLGHRAMWGPGTLLGGKAQHP